MPPANFPLSKLPSRMVSLETSLRVFSTLGGPELENADKLIAQGYSMGTPLMQVLGLATDALSEASWVVTRSERLKPA
jgi:hypothetical protein